MQTLPHTTISAIVAMAENRVIGNNNQLPWRLPADLKHFKAITTGHPILMGRKTYESIGKPLPNRLNIILTHQASFQATGCLIATSLDDVISYVQKENIQEIFIIGGAEIYRQFLPRVERLYLTIVHHSFDGDAYFPQLDMNEWIQKSCETHGADQDNPYAYSFLLLEKK